MSFTNSFTIEMPIGEEESTSPDYTVNGLIWRLHAKEYPVVRPRGRKELFLLCESGGRGDLWAAETQLTLSIEEGETKRQCDMIDHRFVSWSNDRCDFTRRPFKKPAPLESEATKVTVELQFPEGVQWFPRRPILDKTALNDVILVLEGQKFPVNKKELAAQSSYFNSLFYGDFKESKQEEIEIKGVTAQDFHAALNMMRGLPMEFVEEEKITRHLQLAELWFIPMLKERVETCLLPTDLISIHRKFLLADEHKLEILKSEVLRLYKEQPATLTELARCADYEDFSDRQVNYLFRSVFGG